MTNQASYRLTLDAQTDLIEIRRYTIQQSTKYLGELRQKIKFLSENPRLGRQHLHMGENIFSFPYASHMIYYSLVDQQLIVFRISHQSIVPKM